MNDDRAVLDVVRSACEADDRWRLDAGAPPKRGPNEDGIIRRRHDNTAPAPAAAPACAANLITEDDMIESVGYALGETRVDMRGEREEALAPLRERIAALEAKIELLAAMLGGKAANPSASVTPLPPRRGVAHVA